MQIIKEFITILDFMLATYLWIVGRQSKEKVVSVGMGIVVVLLFANILMMWS